MALPLLTATMALVSAVLDAPDAAVVKVIGSGMQQQTMLFNAVIEDGRGIRSIRRLWSRSPPGRQRPGMMLAVALLLHTWKTAGYGAGLVGLRAHLLAVCCWGCCLSRHYPAWHALKLARG